MIDDRPNSTNPKIVVVGFCASGKSTLVEKLRSLGYNAVVCAQEHSEISHLWKHSEPDILVYLDTDLATIRSRRGEEWPQTIYQSQHRRLQAARIAADIVLNSTQLDQQAVLDHVLAMLSTRA